MPSKSKAQHNFMAAVAHNPAFAKKAGVPQSVGKEFNQADKGRKFSKGDDMKKGYADGGMTMVNKGGKMVPDFAADGKGKMAKGGMTHKDVKMDKGMMQKAVNKHEGRLHKGEPMTKLAHGGMPKKMNMGGMAYAKGGSVGTTKMGAVKTKPGSINGMATKGKTKGTMVKMSRGGKAC
jgi:hypothetical protein